MAKDEYYNKLIHSSRWINLRREKLTAQPICERCQADGYVTPVGEVHHIRPVESGINKDEMRRLMFDPHNLAALCHKCHVAVHTEIGRSGKAITRQRNNNIVSEAIKRFFD